MSLCSARVLLVPCACPVAAPAHTLLDTSCSCKLARRNLNIVRMIADKQPDLVHAKDDDGDTPLHNAARGGHAEVVQFLLLEGADPNTVNTRGETARSTCGNDVDASLLEALEIAEKHFERSSTVPGVQTPEPMAEGGGDAGEEPGDDAFSN
jgi:Ankyrin repeats (many copies)